MFKLLLLFLTKRLYPKGRAFRIPFGSVKEKLHNGLIESENQACEDALSVLDSIIPDNNNFTTEDASDWERRLGLITNPLVSLSDRKSSILRKLNHPGNIPARQYYLYLQRELHAAGFTNLFVHENRFALPSIIDEQMGVSEMGVSEMGGTTTNTDLYGVMDPDDLLNSYEQMGVSEMGVSEMGGQYSGLGYSIIANHLDPLLDANFLNEGPVYDMGGSEMGVAEMGRLFEKQYALRFSFFICGASIGSFANVSADRLYEFRQLVLKVKPVHTFAICFIAVTGGDFNNDYNNDFLIN